MTDVIVGTHDGCGGTVRFADPCTGGVWCDKCGAQDSRECGDGTFCPDLADLTTEATPPKKV